MLFKFIKYIQPTSYFNLKESNGNYIFPNSKELPVEILCQLNRDELFFSETAIDYDLSWQAIQSGYIGDVCRIKKIKNIPLVDEYRFVRKYFHKVWSTYCLVIRILSFNNPIHEIKAYLSSRNTRRVKLNSTNFQYLNWASFDSSLKEKSPKISVVIPTLNRYGYLKDILNDFEKQDYKNFEIIIVDQSDAFNKDFYDQFELNLHVIRQKEKALWLARNTAIKKAEGEIIALSEDDVRIEYNWLSEHLKCLDFFNADISAGVFYPEGSSIPLEKMKFTIAQQFATGNAMFYKKILLKTGLFDRQFEKQRMGDGEFGLRCFKAGFKSIWNPFASCVDVKAPVGGLRELGSWDAFRPTNWFAPRPVPSVLYFYRSYFGDRLAKYALLKSIPPSIIPYRYKRNKILLFFGFIISFLMIPLLLFQVYKSWKLSSIKLNEGSKIERL